MWLTSHLSSTSSLTVADLDGDGSNELLAGDRLADRVVVVAPTSMTPLASFGAMGELGPADFDGDGDLDLLVPGDGVAWIETRPSPPYPVHDLGPGTGLVAGDIDRDGDPDVVASDDFGLFWLENQGGGAFTTEDHFHASSIGSPRLADLDADGHLDLVGSTLDEIGWFRGDGGFFEPYAALAPGGGDVAIGDFDADGDLDLVWSGTNAQIAWAGNDGSGAYGLPQALLPRGFVQHSENLAVADVDGVPGDEIVAAVAEVEIQYGPVRVRPRIRAWKFAAGSPVAWEPWRPCDATAVGAGDVDADGHIDLVAFQTGSTDTPPTLSVRRADGSGGFQAVEVWTDAHRVLGVVPFDVDDDGVSDLVASIGYPNSLRWIPAGLDGWERTVPLAEIREPLDLQADDVDGDGVAEILVGPAVLDVSNGVATVEELLPGEGKTAIGDLDGDGDPDVLTCGSHVLHTNDGGVFTSRVGPDPTADSGCRLRDLDGDGADELLTWQWTTLVTYQNAGDGTFGPPQPYDLGGGLGIWDVEVGDLDSDGDADLVVGTYGSSQLLVRGASGELGPPVELPTQGPADGAIADFDVDGDLDLLVIRDLQLVSWFEQVQGALAAPVDLYDLGDQAYVAGVADVDADGDQDVTFAYNSLSGSGVLVNPHFGPPPTDPSAHTGEVQDTGTPADGHTGDPVSDGPTDDAGKDLDDGCNCRNGPGASPWWALAVLALARRRRGPVRVDEAPRAG